MVFCLGFSIFLIDVCCFVGVLVRFVGILFWLDWSGNYFWVEVWDDGWYFIGVVELIGNEFDWVWFMG